jgi:SAM-dependent methyltransferase
MVQEVHGLGHFYATATGAVAARLLRDRMHRFWPDLRGQSVLGLGYASPFLRLWRGQAARCVALVPDHLPRWRWPRSAPSLSAVGAEDRLPFPDLMFDRVLIVHGLEHAENTRRLLREAWRVLRDDGRLLVVAPNRLGLWAHLERTPFGHGHPWSRFQLEALLRRQMFAVERRDHALFVPPFRSRALLRGAAAWERVGRAAWPGLAGVTLMEAQKDCFSALALPAAASRHTPRRVMVPAGARGRQADPVVRQRPRPGHGDAA